MWHFLPLLVKARKLAVDVALLGESIPYDPPAAFHVRDDALVDIDTEHDLEALRRSVAAARFGGVGDWSAASTF